MSPRARCLRLVAMVALLAAATSGAARNPRREVLLTVLHTSDLHGQVLPVDAAGRPHGGSLAQVASLVRRVRATAPGPVLVLDSGDALQGSPLEVFNHVEWGEPSPTITAMNTIGYAAMAVGNHEFNFGRALLERARGEASFPFLSANIVDAASGAPAFEPYRIFELAGVKVGVLGLTTPAVPGWEQPDHIAGLEFEPIVAAARTWVAELAARTDLVIVLAHSGLERLDADGQFDDSDDENFVRRLAQVPGIDVLLAGHTHRDVAPEVIDGVIVAQPRDRATSVVRLELKFARTSSSGWRLAGWDGAIEHPAGLPPDPAIERAAAPAMARVEQVLDVPIGGVSSQLTVAGCRVHDCAVVDLLHTVQLAASGADLSLASLLTDATPDTGPGQVTRRWIHTLYVYPNELVTVRVTGAEVHDILEYALRYYVGLSAADHAGWQVTVDDRIPIYNVDSLAGLSYRIDPTAPVGERARDLRFRGQSFDRAGLYTMVVTDYRAAGGGGFPHLAAAEVVWRSSEEMTDLIEHWLAAHSPWMPAVDGNWWIAPEIEEVPVGDAG